MTRYWLMKSEPNACSIDDAMAAPRRTVPWTGVRNYQARNFMRDDMRVGDGVLFYHSSCPEPGIAGIAQVASGVRPDPTQFEPDSDYFDAKSDPADPRWLLVDIKALRKTRLLGLPELRATPALADLLLLRRGNRLSITPVDKAHWDLIVDDRRHLHDAYSAADATLADCIQRRRIQACMRELADPLRARHTITEIAFSWGFNDGAHFSRVFREHTGRSPSDFREAALRQGWPRKP